MELTSYTCCRFSFTSQNEEVLHVISSNKSGQSVEAGSKHIYHGCVGYQGNYGGLFNAGWTAFVMDPVVPKAKEKCSVNYYAQSVGQLPECKKKKKRKHAKYTCFSDEKCLIFVLFVFLQPKRYNTLHRNCQCIRERGGRERRREVGTNLWG